MTSAVATTAASASVFCAVSAAAASVRAAAAPGSAHGCSLVPSAVAVAGVASVLLVSCSTAAAPAFSSVIAVVVGCWRPSLLPESPGPLKAKAWRSTAAAVAAADALLANCCGSDKPFESPTGVRCRFLDPVLLCSVFCGRCCCCCGCCSLMTLMVGSPLVGKMTTLLELIACCSSTSARKRL